MDRYYPLRDQIFLRGPAAAGGYLDTIAREWVEAFNTKKQVASQIVATNNSLENTMQTFALLLALRLTGSQILWMPLHSPQALLVIVFEFLQRVPPNCLSYPQQMSANHLHVLYRHLRCFWHPYKSSKIFCEGHCSAWGLTGSSNIDLPPNFTTHHPL